MTRHYDEAGLQELIDGQCSARERDAMRTHLDACPVCASRYRGLRVVDRGLHRLPLERPAHNVTTAVMARIGRAHSRTWLDVALDPRILSAVAVGAFGTVVAGTMGFMALQKSPAPGSTVFPQGVADRIGGFVDTGTGLITRVVPQVVGTDALNMALVLVGLVPLFILADRFLAMRRVTG